MTQTCNDYSDSYKPLKTVDQYVVAHVSQVNPISAGNSGSSNAGAGTTGAGNANTGTETGQSTSASTPTTSSSSPRTLCGTTTGGADDFQGQPLTVYAGPGVSSSTAMSLMNDITAGQARDHFVGDIAGSYYTIDGWKCPYGNMGTFGCENGTLSFTAYAPGAQP
jgi:hypothetical protein